MLCGKHCVKEESFEALVVGLCEGGNVDDACFVLEAMEKRRMVLGFQGWTALVVASCLHAGKEIELPICIRKFAFVVNIVTFVFVWCVCHV